MQPSLVSLHPRLPWLFIKYFPLFHFCLPCLLCALGIDLDKRFQYIYKQPIPYSVFCARRMVPHTLWSTRLPARITMSNGLNWLKKLRRAEVNDLAHAAGLEEYAPGMTE
jgi:hypothetical protein